MQEETVQPGETSPQEKPLEERLAEAQATILQQRDTLMRAVADAENARKRAQAEAASGRKYAVESLAENLLPVVDSLESALKTGDTSGVEITQRQLQGALQKAGIRELDPKPGERFDPHRHQAMAAVPTEGDPNTIVTVMQKGYVLHDRVLRPALVTVSKALEKSAGNPTSDTDLD